MEYDFGYFGQKSVVYSATACSGFYYRSVVEPAHQVLLYICMLNSLI